MEGQKLELRTLHRLPYLCTEYDDAAKANRLIASVTLMIAIAKKKSEPQKSGTRAYYVVNVVSPDLHYISTIIMAHFFSSLAYAHSPPPPVTNPITCRLLTLQK